MRFLPPGSEATAIYRALTARTNRRFSEEPVIRLTFVPSRRLQVMIIIAPGRIFVKRDAGKG